MFCTHLRTKSDYFTIQHQQTRFHNTEGKCLLALRDEFLYVFLVILSI